MRTPRYTYWQDQAYFLGYLNDYPEYKTQVLSKEELMHNLTSLLEDIEIAAARVRTHTDLAAGRYRRESAGTHVACVQNELTDAL